MAHLRTLEMSRKAEIAADEASPSKMKHLYCGFAIMPDGKLPDNYKHHCFKVEGETKEEIQKKVKKLVDELFAYAEKINPAFSVGDEVKYKEGDFIVRIKSISSDQTTFDFAINGVIIRAKCSDFEKFDRPFAVGTVLTHKTKKFITSVFENGPDTNSFYRLKSVWTNAPVSADMILEKCSDFEKV